MISAPCLLACWFGGVFFGVVEARACTYADLLTPLQQESHWQYSLLDTEFMLSEGFAPSDLVALSDYGVDSDLRLRELVVEDLLALLADSEAAGYPLAIQSAYRSYSYQARVFNYWVAQEGYDNALLTSARAGHSEHQLGTVVDFRSAEGPPAWELADWAQTPTGAWLAAEAWRYGFVMSYPKGARSRTCYSYEPWHYRYIGKELAKELEESGLVLREWLLNTHQTTDEP